MLWPALFLVAPFLAASSTFNPLECQCNDGDGYMYAEGRVALCGLAYLHGGATYTEATACLANDMPGRVLCSAPKGTGQPVKNCDPDYRCPARILRDNILVDVQSLGGLVQIDGSFWCVRGVEEIATEESPCKEGELARCVVLVKPINAK